MTIFPYLIAAYILIIGLYGVISSRNFVHITMCLAVVQSSTYVLLLSVGYRWGAGAPIFASVSPGSPAVDPIVQALMLTDIVVEATVVALLLSLAVQVQKASGTVDPDKLLELQG